MTARRPPTSELRDYALGRAAPAVRDRVREYLLVSADEEALRYVADLSEAALRAEFVLRRASILDRALGVIGAAPSRVADALLLRMGQPEPALLDRAQEPRPTVVFDVEGAPQWLYLLAVDAVGTRHLLHPTDLAVHAATNATPTIAVPEGTTLVVGIATERPLLTSTDSDDPAHALSSALQAMPDSQWMAQFVEIEDDDGE